MQVSGQTQVSCTDEDARLLSKSGQRLAGYNVQIEGDEKRKLIVASAVVTDGNDSRQLSALAVAACELAGIDAYVPVSGRGDARPIKEN